MSRVKTKNPKNIPCSFSIPPELKENLEVIISAKNTTKSKFLTSLIKGSLNSDPATETYLFVELMRRMKNIAPSQAKDDAIEILNQLSLLQEEKYK